MNHLIGVNNAPSFNKSNSFSEYHELRLVFHYGQWMAKDLQWIVVAWEIAPTRTFIRIMTIKRRLRNVLFWFIVIVTDLEKLELVELVVAVAVS